MLKYVITKLNISNPLGITIFDNKSYQERWRDWPYETSATIKHKSLIKVPIPLSDHAWRDKRANYSH